MTENEREIYKKIIKYCKNLLNEDAKGTLVSYREINKFVNKRGERYENEKTFIDIEIEANYKDIKGE